MKKNKSIGSNFDDFLRTECILEEIEKSVTNKISDFKKSKELEKQKADNTQNIEFHNPS